MISDAACPASQGDSSYVDVCLKQFDSRQETGTSLSLVSLPLLPLSPWLSKCKTFTDASNSSSCPCFSSPSMETSCLQVASSQWASGWPHQLREEPWSSYKGKIERKQMKERNKRKKETKTFFVLVLFLIRKRRG